MLRFTSWNLHRLTTRSSTRRYEQFVSQKKALDLTSDLQVLRKASVIDRVAFV
jgi:hypothetical protein